ncbi:MAG: 2-C-methyl-D-erythritol 2,4-cyclodiphosphate synthase [Candidatus Omnitrophica bacterium]|nr:2-C-methyl-D-erythritol 2,4-cyclodiphosphate synthase [Candidatus Omnitrophota bacterium]
MRVGIGYDIHALRKGRKLILGGVEVPFAKGLWGHSDGDVLFHAVTDAVLGAMGEGDMGELFPDHDERYRGASGLFFLRSVRDRLKKRRLKVSHVDATVIAEAPRLSAYKGKMRENAARGLGLSLSQVGIKAKTNEGFGAVGAKQAIACFAVASLEEVHGGKKK